MATSTADQLLLAKRVENHYQLSTYDEVSYLRTKKAELETELRLAKEQLARTENGTVQLATCFSSIVNQAQVTNGKAVERRLQQVEAENAELKRRLEIAEAMRVETPLELEFGSKSNASRVNTINTDKTSTTDFKIETRRDSHQDEENRDAMAGEIKIQNTEEKLIVFDDDDDVASASTLKVNTEGETSSTSDTRNQLNDRSHSNSVRSSFTQVDGKDGGVGSDGHGKLLAFPKVLLTSLLCHFALQYLVPSRY